MTHRRKISDREIARAMELASAAGRPEDVGAFHVCPELAKYFAGRIGLQFLLRLREDANRETGESVAGAIPNEKTLSTVQLAYQQSEKFPTRYRHAAAVFTSVPSILLTVKYGPQGLFLVLLLVLAAYMVGRSFDQKAFYRGSVYLAAVTVVRAALVYERQSSEYWSNLHWRDLELEVSRLFQRIGYKAEATPASNDKGVDVLAFGPEGRIVIQCKQYAKPAQRNVVSELLGVMRAEKADRGILICTGGFSPSAESYAADNGVELWDLAEITRRCKNPTVGTVTA